MRERWMNWFSSLRIRLIITYVLVMTGSYALLLFLVMKPVEDFMISREENTLRYLAGTLGSTINSPWPSKENPLATDIDEANDRYLSDLWWNQRRTYVIASEIDARIRTLDASGRVLTDSTWGHPGSRADWLSLKEQRGKERSVALRPEVINAKYGYSSSKLRVDDERPGGVTTLFVAKPIMRQQDGRSKVAFIIYINRSVESVKDTLSTIKHFWYYGMLVSLSITIFVTILLSSQLSAGLQSAMRVARGFAAGKMDLRMRERGRDEVGQLGSAFNQMAEALQRQEQLRRDLLADVSHELRTPLTAISGCADTLADGLALEDPKTAERFLHIIQRESERLQRLVSDILELSKLQAGAVRIPVKPVPITPIIEDAVEIAAMHVRQGEDLTIRAAYPDQTPYATELLVLGNEDRLAQALRNLLDNARHHSPSGSVITVMTEVKPETVIIHVSDQGEGIPPDEIPWVFDRFYRAGKGEKKTGGTGLGLPIVRAIMHAHQGKVTVESTIGAGATFSLHLKRVQAEDARV